MWTVQLCGIVKRIYIRTQVIIKYVLLAVN